ncbi:MAG: DUF1007 family protein [Parvibaculum sp.]|nr:DUF1007 family protein [Parvibaculum sp.]
MKWTRQIKARVFPLALFACVLCVSALPAAAHPHVFLDMKADLGLTADHKLNTLTITWEFDEFYSAFAVEGFKKDAAGHYKQSDLDAILKINLDNLKDDEWHYFTNINQSGKALTFGDAKPVGASFDNKTGRLTISFTLPLTTPVIPTKASPVLIQIYDPTYYISVEFVKKNPLTLSGEGHDACTTSINVPDAEKIWSTLPKSAFTGGDVNVGAGFGSNFASTLTLICSPG